jgi:CoA:oxalate CoA-transferase
MTAITGGALEGLRVLDFTQFLSGPYGTQMLGDMGADVLKIESPAGDLSRSVAPNFVRGDSVYFHTINRNKRSLVIDLKKEGALEVVRSLIDNCDVVMENFRPDVLKRLGLDAQEELERRPDLIWCSISGFGQDGPSKDLPAYDMVVQGLSGAMSLTGEEGGRPLRTGIPVGDLAAGLHAVIGVLASLERRRRTGLGDYIDVSMLDCLISMLSYQATYYLHSGVRPHPQGTGHDSVPTYRAFAASDQDIVITANTERMWASLATALGLADLVDDPRFSTNAERLRNKEALWGLIEPAFLARTGADWVRVLGEVSVPASLVNEVPEALSNPQVVHRKMVIQLTHEDGTQIGLLGNPIKQREMRSEHSFPPAIGEDTVAVLREFAGLDDTKIDELLDLGVIKDGRKQ